VAVLEKPEMSIVAAEVRYIKLGKGGSWERVSLERSELHFGHGKVPHEMGLVGNADVIKQHRIGQGRAPQTAAGDAREVVDFYRLGSDCLWITFADDLMWWTFAEPAVKWLGFGDGHGERIRKTIGGWRSTDINGVPIRKDSLSTKLTKVANYRRTICAVEAKEYLLRRLNGVAEPIVVKGNHARQSMIAVLTEAIASLHWADFETLVDILFARSGWHRGSEIGGTQKIVDGIFEQPTTGERAAVQVKSRASQSILDAFLSAADGVGTFDRLFFACHSPTTALSPPTGRSDVHIWAGADLATAAFRGGMSDWILEKVS
jgi:hypothetical protein